MLTRAIIASLSLSALVLSAQTPAVPSAPVPRNPSDQLEVQVFVVNVPVTVTDQADRFVVDLEKKDFSLWEDGKLVNVRYFTSDPKLPVTVGFLLDASNTARLYFKVYQDALTDLAFTLLPGDNQNKGFLASYATEVDFLAKPTKDEIGRAHV